MQVQVNTDRNINNTEALAERIEGMVGDALERYAEQVTRVEVHLSDENSAEKFGTDDKRCVMEVRIAGRQPVAVTHHAANVELAVEGASEKMRRLLSNSLGKLAKH